MVYVKNDPKCGDPDAPIDSYLKRHLNPQICALCQELKKKKREELQKKGEEKKGVHRPTRGEVQRQIREGAQRIRETVANEKRTGKRFFTNEFGERISY